MRDSLGILRTDDFIEHHGVPGMKWGVRHQQRIAEKYTVSALKKLKKKITKSINKYEKKQYKLAKPYADERGHFKITDPKKAEEHFKLSEEIVKNKKALKQIEDALKNGPKKVNKRYADTSMMNIHAQLAMQAHNTAVQQHQSFMHQVQQQNTLQTIQNFHNQMHFDNMINMQNIHTHNMMF